MTIQNQRPPVSSDTHLVLHGWRAFGFPLAFTTLILLASLAPRVQGEPALARSFWVAAAVLLLWQAALWTGVIGRGRDLGLRVEPRSQHYVQAAVQMTLLVYWGWYWPPMRDAALLIVAQLLFAYTFLALLSWSRGRQFVLGFGPFPIVLSTNLFLWFKDEWFIWQFVMIAAGFLGKEFIRWTKNGRRTHIFNPSALSLSLVSLGLLIFDGTPLTWGGPIATELFVPPYIYLVIFLLGLVVQSLFAVTLMTLSAVATVFVFSAGYLGATGVYYFIDSSIPVAVFLGMHLLVTDPSTSPRTLVGRVLFGVLYGLSVVVLYALLGGLGVPTFYDKLLGVPLLNLAVRFLDRLATRWRPSEAPARALRGGAGFGNLVHIGAWVALFGVMTATGAVGDSHEGHTVPFWQRACDEGRRNGCDVLALIETVLCESGSGWACNELAIASATGRRGAPAGAAGRLFARACDHGFEPGCENTALADTELMVEPRRGPPGLVDWVVLLQQGKGALPDMEPVELWQRACDQQWAIGCAGLGLTYLQGRGVVVDTGQAAVAFEQACELGDAGSCSNLGLMYDRGDGVPADRTRALDLLGRACDLGMGEACLWLEAETKEP